MQAVNLESHAVMMTCIYEDPTCISETFEAPNPNPHNTEPPSVVLLLLMWIVHILGSGLEVRWWSICACGRCIQPLVVDSWTRVIA